MCYNQNVYLHHSHPYRCLLGGQAVEEKRHSEITFELLEKLRIEAMLREDELASETGRVLESIGTLNDPELSELANEAEDIGIEIAHLERMLAQFDYTRNDKR